MTKNYHIIIAKEHVKMVGVNGYMAEGREIMEEIVDDLNEDGIWYTVYEINKKGKRKLVVI